MFTIESRFLLVRDAALAWSDFGHRAGSDLADGGRRDYSSVRFFHDISSRSGAGDGLSMNSQSIAGVLGAIIASIVMVVAIAYGPIGQSGKPAKPASTQQAAPAPPVPAAPAPRGPVIREVPN